MWSEYGKIGIMCHDDELESIISQLESNNVFELPSHGKQATHYFLCHSKLRKSGGMDEFKLTNSARKSCYFKSNVCVT